MATGKPLSHWRKLTGSIPAGQTVDIDVFSVTSFRSIHYKQSYFSDTENKIKSLEMAVSKQSGSLIDQVSNENFGGLDLSINLVEETSEGKLRVVNNESFAVGFVILKSIM